MMEREHERHEHELERLEYLGRAADGAEVYRMPEWALHALEVAELDEWRVK